MADEFGIGQQEPTDSGSEFNAIAFLCQQMMARMATMRLVEVKAVSSNGEIAAAGTVDVLPLVNQIDGDGNAQPHGVVHGVPWYRLQGGKNAIICDPQVGDIGYVDVADRDISIVKSSKKQGNPGSRRMYDLADGVYVGGVLNPVPDQYILFGDGKIEIVDKNGNSVLLDSSGVTVTDKSGNVLKMQSGGFDLTGNLAVHGAITATGNVTAGFGGSFATLLAHIHSANNTPPTPGH